MSGGSSKKPSSQLVDLVYEALLKSFWRKAALKRYLRRTGISDSFLASWDTSREGDETKRRFLDRLFGVLEGNPKQAALFWKMANDLSCLTEFTDLNGWEDSDLKIEDAQQAVKALKTALGREKEAGERERQKDQRRQQAQAATKEIKRSEADREQLLQHLNELATRMGTSEAGYDFERWFYDLMDYYDVEHRVPYKHDGRQIDGSVTIDGTTYLVELKFTADQSDVTAVDSFLVKVNKKADNTMGIMVSMSGYSSVAIKEASGPKTPLLLLDFNHVHLCLSGVPFPEVVARLRRHASQTGEAYLSAAVFGQ
jgi:hypothetical protein